MTVRGRVLVVDPDAQLRQLLEGRLTDAGIEPALADTGAHALALARRAWPDLVIIELALPDMTGDALAERLKAIADVPIVVLSALGAPASRIDHLERYAEDFVTKPFYVDELLVRVRRILGRTSGDRPAAELVLGPELTLDLPRRQAIVDGRVVALSPLEARVLTVLAGRLGDAVSTERLLSRAWSATRPPDPASVWVMIRRLRRKIEPAPHRPRYLVTAPGVGYLLQPAEPVADPPSPGPPASTPALGGPSRARG